MALPAELPLDILYGTDAWIDGTVTDGAGVAVDLTLPGVALEFDVKPSVTAPSTVLTKTIGAGIVANADGTYSVHVGNTDRTLLLPAVYAYAIVYTDPDGNQAVVARGRLGVVGNARS